MWWVEAHNETRRPAVVRARKSTVHVIVLLVEVNAEPNGVVATPSR